jgi:hypothetical protein
MVRICGKAFWRFVPALTDVLISGESLKRFESLGEVIGHQEAMQMLFQVVMSLVVILFHGGVFERAVHAFHLAIRPEMVGFGQPMGNAMLTTDTIKDTVRSVSVALPIGELDTIIDQHGVDLVGYGSNQVPKELGEDRVMRKYRISIFFSVINGPGRRRSLRMGAPTIALDIGALSHDKRYG